MKIFNNGRWRENASGKLNERISEASREADRIGNVMRNVGEGKKKLYKEKMNKRGQVMEVRPRESELEGHCVTERVCS